MPPSSTLTGTKMSIDPRNLNHLTYEAAANHIKRVLQQGYLTYNKQFSTGYLNFVRRRILIDSDDEYPLFLPHGYTCDLIIDYIKYQIAGQGKFEEKSNSFFKVLSDYAGTKVPREAMVDQGLKETVSHGENKSVSTSSYIIIVNDKEIIQCADLYTAKQNVWVVEQRNRNRVKVLLDSTEEIHTSIKKLQLDVAKVYKVHPVEIHTS